MPIVGLVTAQIAMAVDAQDADISVRLSDVYPDGTSFLILDGIARMSLPYPYTTPREITSNEFYRMPVELGHTAYIVDAGHRLRVALAPSNHPRFELNPTLARANEPVELRISLGGDMPSSLQFTVHSGLLDDE
jgi:predicted acyl esterase